MSAAGVTNTITCFFHMVETMSCPELWGHVSAVIGDSVWHLVKVPLIVLSWRMQNLCSTFDPSPEGVVSCKFGIIGRLNPPRGHGGGLLSLHESGVTVTGGHIKRPTAFRTHIYKQNLIPNLPQGHVFGIEHTTFCMAGNSSKHCTTMSPWPSEKTPNQNAGLSCC